jgi:prepilin-type N-terminal cleavage/methylation domain-containing protein
MFNFQFSIFKKNPNSSGGFTLIELIVVITVIGILSTVGVASFVEYSRTQIVRTAVAEYVTILNTARSRTFSQVKPSACTDKIMDGYTVTVTSESTYEFRAECGDANPLVELKTLPPTLTFSEPFPSYFFHLLTGGVTGFGNTTISGYGRSEVITVTAAGGVLTD